MTLRKSADHRLMVIAASRLCASRPWTIPASATHLAGPFAAVSLDALADTYAMVLILLLPSPTSMATTSQISF